MIVVDGDQAPIEHPMHGPSQCDAIADRVGAIVRDWLNMCRLNFGPTTAIQQMQPRNGAAISVCNLHLPSEGSFAERAVNNLLDDWPVKWGFSIGKTVNGFRRLVEPEQ